MTVSTVVSMAVSTAVGMVVRMAVRMAVSRVVVIKGQLENADTQLSSYPLRLTEQRFETSGFASVALLHYRPTLL
jgi:hypothetical protein